MKKGLQVFSNACRGIEAFIYFLFKSSKALLVGNCSQYSFTLYIVRQARKLKGIDLNRISQVNLLWEWLASFGPSHGSICYSDQY